jgi:hypothetical protein
MINARLAVLAGAATVAFAGFAHAATGPVRAPAALSAAQPATPAMQVVGDGVVPAAYPGDGRIMVVSDAAPSMRASWTNAPSPREPLYSNAAGKTSEAPLPGALWLFGGALLAFLGISARRRF